jgi:hypothetical protein
METTSISDVLGPIDFPESATESSMEALSFVVAQGEPGFVSYPFTGEAGEHAHNCKNGRADLIHSIECDNDIYDVDFEVVETTYSVEHTDAVHNGTYEYPTRLFHLIDHLRANERLIFDSTGFPTYGTWPLIFNIRYRVEDDHTFRMNQSFIPNRGRVRWPKRMLLGREIKIGGLEVDRITWSEDQVRSHVSSGGVGGA